MIHVLQNYTEQGIRANEDLIRFGKSFVAVLDGSTAIVPMSVTVQELAAFIADTFSTLLSENYGFADSVNMTIDRLPDFIYGQSGSADTVHTISPSVAGILMNEHNGILELVSLGDCTALIFMKNGEIRKIYSTEVEKFDNAVIDRMIEIKKESGKDISDIVQYPEIRHMLLENRHQMNAPCGYRVFSSNTAHISDADIIRFNSEDISRVVAYTDGFEDMEKRIIDNPDIDFALLCRELRDFEHADCHMNLRPRFKMSDDASVISFTIEKDYE